MPLTDEATVVAGTGHVLIGAAGTVTTPTLAQLTAFLSAGTAITGLLELGHTSADDVATFSQDGGDSTVLPSWQNKTLRTINTTPPVNSFVVKSLQARDNTALDLYYGGGDATVLNTFATPDSPTIQEKSVLLLIDDAQGAYGKFWPRCSVQRGDSIEVTTDNFMDFPIQFTILKASGKAREYIIADGLGVNA